MSDGKYPFWTIEDRKKELWIKFYEYSEGYKQTVLALLENEKEEISKREIDLLENILPVLNNFAQYLELVIKTFLIKDEIDIKELKIHNLQILFNRLQKEKPGLEFSKKVIFFIRDLHDLLVDEQSLRYPINIKNKQRYFVMENKLGGYFNYEYLSKIIKQTIGEFTLNCRKLF